MTTPSPSPLPPPPPPLPPGPKLRAIRTAIQVVVAVCVAIPAAVTTLGLEPVAAAKVTGLAGAIVIVVSAVHNALDARDNRS